MTNADKHDYSEKYSALNGNYICIYIQYQQC